MDKGIARREVEREQEYQQQREDEKWRAGGESDHEEEQPRRGRPQAVYTQVQIDDDQGRSSRGRARWSDDFEPDAYVDKYTPDMRDKVLDVMEEAQWVFFGLHRKVTAQSIGVTKSELNRVLYAMLDGGYVELIRTPLPGDGSKTLPPVWKATGSCEHLVTQGTKDTALRFLSLYPNSRTDTIASHIHFSCEAVSAILAAVQDDGMVETIGDASINSQWKLTTLGKGVEETNVHRSRTIVPVRSGEGRLYAPEEDTTTKRFDFSGNREHTSFLDLR